MSIAKDYLMRIRQIDHSVEYQLEEIQRLRELLTRVTPVMKDDGASGGGFSDKIGSGVAKIVDLQNEIDKSIDSYCDTKRNALQIMKRMERKDYAKLLHLRYFQYKTWEEIAGEMKYCNRNVYDMHGRALVEFERVMKLESRNDRCGHGSQRENDVPESSADEAVSMA